MFDHTERNGRGNNHRRRFPPAAQQGIPLSQAMQNALTAAGLPLIAPSRKDTPGDNGNAGDFRKARHTGRQYRAAEIFRRRRYQGRAANVQSTQQAVRAGVVVARSGWYTAQSRRQPSEDRSRHQRTDLAGLHQECRRQPRAGAPGVGRSRTCCKHRYCHCRRPRILRPSARRAVPVRPPARVTRMYRPGCCRRASLRSISPKRLVCH